MKQTSFSQMAVAISCLVGGIPLANSATLSFDAIASLNDYAPAVTFSANASIWTYGGPTVLENPDGGAYSFPSALQFGNAGGVLGYAYFATAQSAVSVWALSGPGSDRLSAGMYIKGFAPSDALIAEDRVDSSLQFDLLALSGSGIVRLEFWSPNVANDVWDDLTYASAAIPEPPTGLLLSVAIAGLIAGGLRAERGSPDSGACASS